jgi:septal ring factor EnvC (AmiA/AmiB activator)
MDKAMRALPLLALPLLIAPALMAAGSAPVSPEARPIDLALRTARAEAQAADAATRKHLEAAKAARSEAGRLHARQAAAADAIAAAEARISAADAEAAILGAQLAARRTELARKQAPAAALLAGLAMMAERPPLLAIADSGSVEELVRVRLLLDSTLPAIRKRTASLSADLQDMRALETRTLTARNRLQSTRDLLARRKTEFAALESDVLKLAEKSGNAALSSGDVALARTEDAEQLARQLGRSESTGEMASELASLGFAPPRPIAAESARKAPPIAYILPSEARVLDGLGAVDQSGVRSRGLQLATTRGSTVRVPSSGTIRFAGPFRQHDGVVVIDHGNGWTSLILGVASAQPRGSKVEMGAVLGRALGPIGVELSHDGAMVSPALIAGSSRSLSNGPKGR